MTSTAVLEKPQKQSPNIHGEISGYADCCSARAYGKATKGAGELFFCGHHLGRHYSALVEGGWKIRDERDRLVKK